MRLILAWNIACACCVLLPLLVLVIDRIVKSIGNNNNGERAEWGWGDGPDNEGVGSTLFAYFWTLLLFLVLCLYGNSVLKSKRRTWFGNDKISNSRKLGTLTGATFVFANLAFVLFVVVGGSLIQWDRPQDEGLWSSSMFVPLTFLLWWTFGVVFSILLYRRDENNIYDDDADYEKNTSTNSRKQDDKDPGYLCMT